MAANPTLDNAAVSRSPLVVHVPRASALAAVRTRFIRLLRTAEARRYLGRLDDRMLRDVGFDPEDARREAEKPFWKPYALKRSWDR